MAAGSNLRIRITPSAGDGACLQRSETPWPRKSAIKEKSEPTEETRLSWTVSEALRAKFHMLVCQQRKKHRYPPDEIRKVVETLLRHDDLLVTNWVGQ